MWHAHRWEFEWRYHYFACCVLPRLQAQTVQDFDICILADPQDHDRLKELHKRIRPFTLDTPGFFYSKQGNFKYEQTRGLDRYKVQIRLDSDDLVSPRFVETCQRSEKTVVTFQPELFILKQLKVKRMNHRYSSDKPSMFMSFRSPEPYRCIYHEVFLRFGKYDCEFHPEGDCWMTVHSNNRSTGELS